jgi:hypothetical protein
MKDRRTIVRASMLVVALAAAMLLLFGIHVVMASPSLPAGPADLDPDFPSAPRSTTDWSSGWVTIPLGTCSVFNHNLGADPDEYAVDLWFWDLDDGWGINRRYYGGAEENGATYGVRWQGLTANTIRVCRGSNDDAADRVRIHVWDPPAAPDYDSGWTDINQGQTIIFPHNVGITHTDLTVGLTFSHTTWGIHRIGYGGLAIDDWQGITQKLWGAHWHNLTDNAVRVTRHPHDPNVQQVRVIVVHADRPHYDSLEDVGGWQSIGTGTTYTFTHNLHWNPNLLMARGECYSPTVGGANGGVHHWLAGGNHHWALGWKGANVQNLRSNTVQVFRQPNDDVCPRFRVRIWKRGFPVYLPLVMLSS